MTPRIQTTLALCAVVATCSIGINAQILPYSQSPGFYSGSTNGNFEQAIMNNIFSAGAFPDNPGPPTVVFKSAGGLDFFNDSPLPPAAPPANTKTTIGWGCPFPSQSTEAAQVALCANAGLFFPPNVGSPASSPWGNPGRSALQVFGSSGTLDTVNWKPITTVKHQNFGIYGSRLTFAQVQSFLRLNGACIDGQDASCSTPSLTGVDFNETPNGGPCTQSPDPGNAPANPLGSVCDDYALVSGLDLTTLLLPPGSPWWPDPLNTGQFLVVDFRLNAVANNGAIVCDGSANQPQAACTATGASVPYNGFIGADTDPTIIVYTRESAQNQIVIEAKLRPIDVGPPVPLFVIGDCEYTQAPPGQAKKNPIPATENNLREVDDVVNFWGSQWWKNNCMSSFVDNGYPAFKGYATNAFIVQNPTPGQTTSCGTWQARPGNSGHPPDTLPRIVDIIVTNNVIKDGPNISGNIKQIVRVDRQSPLAGKQDNYAGNPGHQGWGAITEIRCGPIADPPNHP